MLTEIKRLKPEAIIMAGPFEESIEMLKVLKQAGWFPRAYFASVGPALKEFYEIAGKDAEGIFSSSHWEPRNDMPSSMDFYRSFKNRFKTEPSYHSATAYTAGLVLEQA